MAEEGINISIVLTNWPLPEDGGMSVFVDEISKYFESIEENQLEYVKAFMRESPGPNKSGLKEKDSLVAETRSQANEVDFEVYSTAVQALVDEGGRRSGAEGAGFPPFGPESELRDWVVRTLAPAEKDEASVAFLVARAINERGLPAPDDYLHRPFARTLEETIPAVVQGVGDANKRALERLLGE